MEILYESNDLIVCNKPSGLPVQADKTGDPNLLQKIETLYNQPFHIVNRLDRPVSGVVVLAKNKKEYNRIMSIWSTRKVRKVYIAIVEGRWSDEDGMLKDLILKGRRNKAIIDSRGKFCQLSFICKKRLENYSLVELMPITGRFHQIRVQLANVGHPIRGDVKYGARRKESDRSIYLHCNEVSIDNRLFFKCKPDMRKSLWKLSYPIIDTQTS